MAPLHSSETDFDFGHVARMLLNWQFLCAACGLWLFYVARYLPAGLFRSLASLPVAAVLLNATPYLLDRCKMPVLFIPHMTVMSISAFKVAAFGIGRGPLAMEQCDWYNSLPQFLVVLSLPIIPTAALKPRKATSTATAKCTTPTGKHQSGASNTPLPLPLPTSPTTVESYLYALAGQAAVIAVAVYVGLLLWLPEVIRHWFYTLCLVLSLQSIWDSYGLLAALFFGIEPSRSFNQPWMSSTLAEYWARRWNLPVTHMLRVVVYDPIIERRVVPAAPQAEPTAGPAAAPTTRNNALVTGPFAAGNSTCNSKGAPHSPRTRAAAIIASLETPAAGALQHHEGSVHHDAVKVHEGSVQTHDQCISSKPSLLLRFAALQASFAFSGVWHTLIFYYTTGCLIPHWFAFFAIQAPACVAETVVLKITQKQGVKIPHAVSVFLTNFALIVVGSPLLFAPVDWSGLGWAFYDNVAGQITQSEWSVLCRNPADAVSSDHLTRGKPWMSPKSPGGNRVAIVSRSST